MQGNEAVYRNGRVCQSLNEDLIVTIFDGKKKPRSIRLADFNREEIVFGQYCAGCDLILDSPIVSHPHGRFILRNGQWYIEDRECFDSRASSNGIIYNNSYISSWPLREGDFIRIDDGVQTVEDGVLFLFSSNDSRNNWNTLSCAGRSEITIGRNPQCDIVLPHITVSRHHATIVKENDGYYLIDHSSTNGVVINNKRLSGRICLHEKDVIVIANSTIIFTSEHISYCSLQTGISVDVVNVKIERGKGSRKFTTKHNIDLSIRPGELVAIVGGSGSGKSTILNCMSGYIQPKEGRVYVNGIDLYENFDSLKEIIGYVPQADIVYDKLTLIDMLKYTAKMRLPKELTSEERDAAVHRAIQAVELTGYEKRLIGSQLSGGQKKRASIAVELLSNPSLLFLDEPASGLDPGIEKAMMHLLRQLANEGKTIALVTHSVLQLAMCDKVLFMGVEGRVCFYGSLDDAMRFFGITDITDVYDLLLNRDKTEELWAQFNRVQPRMKLVPRALASSNSLKRSKKFQIPVLCARYFRLLLNDRQRSLVMLLQPPILAALISFVADGTQYGQYEQTKSILFALSCAVFWIGMSNSIQEICKERNIVKREYMTGMSLSSYLFSKFLSLGVICFVQSLLATGVFAKMVGLPKSGRLFSPFFDILIFTFLTTLAASAIGLLVSSLFTNPDRALSVVPILLLPQLLFSGIIFDLTGVSKYISWFTICRWSMAGYGTAVNLNALQLRCSQMGHTISGVEIPHLEETYFKYTASHMISSIGLLLIFSVGAFIIARLALSSMWKEET